MNGHCLLINSVNYKNYVPLFNSQKNKFLKYLAVDPYILINLKEYLNKKLLLKIIFILFI